VELAAKSRPNIRFSARPESLKDCRVVFVSLDIPTDRANRSDLTPLRAVIQSVTPHLSSGSALVVLSQVPPGFTRALRAGIAHDRRVQLYYQVETLIFGSAVERALRPERFIVGCDSADEMLPQPFHDYLSSFDCPILKMRYESAELTKISINMFLIASVSMTNTLAELCERIGAEWSEIAPALRLDRRIGPHAYLDPGLGIAGGNLERDLITIRDLALANGTDAAVPAACQANSDYRKDWAFRVLQREVLSKVAKPVIGVLGLAYKANTASTRNSPALALIDSLAGIPVNAYDPQAAAIAFTSDLVSRVDSAIDACRNASAVVIATPWKEFSSLDLSRAAELMSGRILIDPYGVVDPKSAAEMAFRHFRAGSSR
jgi:UDPglucose 6-dehydrogenase